MGMDCSDVTCECYEGYTDNYEDLWCNNGTCPEEATCQYGKDPNAICKHIVNIGVERGRCRIEHCIYDDRY